MGRTTRVIVTLLFVAGLAALGWALVDRLSEQGSGQAGRRQAGPAAVEVAAVERRPIELRRMFSGTLEARAQFVVAPKVGGRLERLRVDVSDPVKRGQVVAELDDDELLQAIAQAEADVAVATANIGEAESAVEIAKRELERVRSLREKGIASASELDAAVAVQAAKEAAVKVAAAQATRAEAALATARIRLAYTQVTASWPGDDERRVVAERYVDAGDTVSANTPLLSIVQIDPINGIVYATEKDYADLEEGKRVTLTTDAWPDRAFVGHITRIAPVFRQASRQARVELEVPNAERMLKPGMFVRAEVVLERVEAAVVIPFDALATRDGREGVFLVDEDGGKVSWRSVEIGIRDGDWVQVVGEPLVGRVVTLGQQLLDDGSPIVIPGEDAASAGEPRGGGSAALGGVTAGASTGAAAERAGS